MNNNISIYNDVPGKLHFKIMGILFPVMILFSCSGKVTEYTNEGIEPLINPDYSGITIPPNIAPLNFMVDVPGDKYKVHIYSLTGEGIFVTSNEQGISIPEKKWRKLLDKCCGMEILMDVYVRRQGKWKKFETIVNQVANEPIDSYMVYRLFDAGFEAWNKMGIYQRCLENFKVTPLMVNEISQKNCMNCHTFNKNNSNTMMFHLREKVAGTIIYKDGKIRKVNTKTDQTITPGMFASWHPGGRYIAFSNNHNPVFFNAIHDKLRETVDTLSDLVMYDTEKNVIYKFSKLATQEKFETFPSWSPDGKYLYFCSANAAPINKMKDIRYDLLRVAFDEQSFEFGKIDTVLYATSDSLSASFPRISPDGRYLLFCMSSYGNFSIWNSTSDLYLLDLQTGKMSFPMINSEVADSYHTWSSNGRWIVFSSKRYDGHGTLPYFTYFDNSGIAHKPFLLPQKNPEFYNTFLRSYNIPELVTTKIDLDPDDFFPVLKTDPEKATLEIW